MSAKHSSSKAKNAQAAEGAQAEKPPELKGLRCKVWSHKGKKQILFLDSKTPSQVRNPADKEM